MKKLISLWVSLILAISAFSGIAVAKAAGGMADSEPIGQEAQYSAAFLEKENSLGQPVLSADKTAVTVTAGAGIQNVSLMMASYKGGQLLGVTLQKITLSAKETKQFPTSYKENADTLKVFLWEGTENLRPLCDGVTVDLTATQPTLIPTVQPTPTAKPTPTPTAIPGKHYTFGNKFQIIKAFDTQSLAETAIGDTGFKVATSTTTNYNNVVVMSNTDKSNGTGYYPYENGLITNQYYLFFGGGGNSGSSLTLTLPEAAKAGQYIAVTYAKPYATNNGTINRSAGNACTMSAGGETVDIEGSCEYDLWHTSVIKALSDVQTMQFELGKWSAVAIESISILDEADMLQISVEGNVNEKYIGTSNETVQYTANVYQSMTMKKDTGEAVALGSKDAAAKVTYSIHGYSGVSIDDNGLLTITPSAKAGTVTVTATFGSISKTMALTLLEVGDADRVQVYGEELAAAGSTVQYKAIPSAKGSIIPARATEWSIEGETFGCTVQDGLLTVPANAKGTLRLKATLKVEGKQTTPNVSGILDVTLGETDGVFDVQGIGFKDGLTEIQKATGVEMVALKQKDNSVQGAYQVVLKAFGENDGLLAESKTPVAGTKQGIQSVAASLDFEKASYIKAYAVDQNGLVVSSKIARLENGIYKNLPVRADWLVGKDGSSVMEGNYNPANGVVPSGVDPKVVDTVSSNANYTYDQDYPAVNSKNILWYKTGAYDKNSNIYQRDSVDWEKQALPVGNGYMGAMVFGMPAKDHIQFNEETFWGSGYNGHQDTNGQWSNLLNAVKTKTTGYTTSELNTYYRNNDLMGEAINGFMNTGNLFVDFGLPEGTTVNNYYRDLNLDEGVSHVQYELDGTTYHREYFASYPDEVVAVHYSADKANALSFDVNFVSAHPGEISVNNGEITVTGTLKDSEPYNAGGKSIWTGASVLEYCDKIKVVADGGMVIDEYGQVRVENANEVTIYMTAATDYDPEAFEIGSDGFLDEKYKTQRSTAQAQEAFKSPQGIQFAIAKAASRLQNVQGKSYADVKAAHITDYKSLFDRVAFHLTGEDEVCNIPTNELVASYTKVVSAKQDGPVDTSPANSDETQHYTIQYDPADYEKLNKHLEELHYNFARYLMISSSRAKSLPATLQGKWNQSVAEIWGSCYCININLEMNYWMVGGANLADDSGVALVQWLKEQVPAGEITAYSTYNIKNESGKPEDDVFVMHTKQSILGTTDMTGGGNIYHIGNSAWLMQNIWDIYQTTGDKEYLASDIYPIMRASANFYKKYMENFKVTTTDTQAYPDGYYYTTGPARSPEHGAMEMGIKYDLQLIASMFDYTIEAAQTLGIDSGKVNEWREIREHMQAPVEIGQDGQIKEWSTETKLAQNASGKQIGGLYHRHMSQLVGLYPGKLMTRQTPEFLEAAKVSLNARGDNATGWSVSNRFLMWARCLDGDKALELFRFQLAQKTYSNLFDYHAPFQIDGNLGSAAGVMELLMQSQTGEIYILPALPSVWKEGSISGIKAKDGAEVSIEWKDGKATKIEITPVTDGDLTIGYEKGNALQLDGQEVTFADGLYTIQNAVRGTTYTFTAK